MIQIAPTDFAPRKKSIHAIEDNIHKKYANKVLQHVGLCICYWDLLKASEGLISQGDGMANVNVVFRLVVFRPFKGEILQGTITEASIEGVRISVDIFDDIWVPGTALMDPSVWSDKDQTWIWEFEGGQYYYEIGEQVRLRVEAEVWHDKTPGKEGPDGEIPVEAMVPYTIIVSPRGMKLLKSMKLTSIQGINGRFESGMFALVGRSGNRS